MVRLVFNRRGTAQPDGVRAVAAVTMGGAGALAGMIGPGPAAGIVAAGTGVLVGWYLVGPGMPPRRRLVRGLTGAGWVGLSLVTFPALQAVTRLAGRGLYRGFEAMLTDFLFRAVGVAAELARPELGIVLFLGGTLSAIVSNRAARRRR
ncbi:hypothetical protein [Paenirhodobacter populi]|uniref:hypothetical protein n=1 Tax=Paenirhodobacter populi TaxID=2306993 RepID=UPI001F4FDB26|nr:hypothetical protein [Sinirhodobacter populi]